MNIINGWPPNFPEIVKEFPAARGPSVIFAYAPDIYAPGRTNLPQHLLVHEAVHIRRQAALGVEEWWRRYLTDAQFRYDEELLAHRAEYQFLQERATSRQHRRSVLKQVAWRLASPLYGVCKLKKAMEDIAA